MNFPNLLLDNQLCFALYSATNAITRYYRFYLKELGITYSQYLVLIALWEGNCKNASDIGKMLKLDLPTITPILQKLEIMNLIKKSRSSEDEVAAIQDKVACKTGLAKAEFNALKATLNDLTDAMEINATDVKNLKLNHCK
jgi:predicted MarR family transcription regulator